MTGFLSATASRLAGPSRARRGACAAALVVGVLATGVDVRAVSTRSGATAQSGQATADRLRELQREAEALDTSERTLLNELRRLEVEREMRTAEHAARQQAVVEAEAAIGQLQREVETLSAAVRQNSPLVQARIVELYKRGPASGLRRLVDAASASDAMRAWRQMSAAARRDADRFERHRSALARLASTRDELRRTHADAAAQRDAAGAARAALDRSVRQQTQRITAIRGERALNRTLQAELAAASAGLGATVERLPRSAAATRPADAPITAFRRALPWPAAGRVARAFRADTPGGLPFNGIEIAVDEGVAVAAVHAGEVAFAGPFTGFGQLVIVQHGAETFTLYGHMSSALVKKGERVTAGQIVGRAGRPPAGGDGRVYFELRVDGQPVNPLQWFRTQ